MKRFFLVLVLAACAPKPTPVASVRDLSRPVYSIAAFDSARLAGDWVQVAGFGKSCNGGQLQVASAIAYDLCLPFGRGSGVAEPSGIAGRFDTGHGGLWVLWADADNRTLVIGAPDGKIGAVLNRGRDISADRMKAARDILGFNGYDVSQLVAY